MQKVAGNYGVKPSNKQLFGNPEQFPKKQTVGKMRDLSVLFYCIPL
ncbi:hypothetical protein [Campylobacter fetus]|nr:hypothetical protein [Campylobacter fetus]